MKKIFVLVATLCMVALLPMSVKANSPTVNRDDIPSARTNTNQVANTQLFSLNNDIVAASVDDDPQIATQSEDEIMIAANIDDDSLIFKAPNTGDDSYIFMYGLVVVLGGAIAVTGKKLKR